jgi:hypothetical protein
MAERSSAAYAVYPAGLGLRTDWPNVNGFFCLAGQMPGDTSGYAKTASFQIPSALQRSSLQYRDANSCRRNRPWKPHGLVRRRGSHIF